MWRTSSPLSITSQQPNRKYTGFIAKGFLINILNPKLSVFFLAFLPQFIPHTSENVLGSMLMHGSIFMLMTFAVFIVYGFLSSTFSVFIVKSERASIYMQKFFSVSFAALGLKLALSERV